MRRSAVRDITLLFPAAVLLILGFLVGIAWHGSSTVQRLRDIDTNSVTEAKLLRSLADELQVVRDQIAGLGENHILGASRSRSVAASGARVLDRVTLAAKAMQASHRHDLHAVKSGIRMLRWVAVLVAALGAIGVFGVVRQLRRAWRRLARAEAEQRLLAQRLGGSLDSLSQGVAVFSAGGLLLNWNARLRQMLELPELLLRSGMPYDALEHHLAGAEDSFLEPLAAIQAEPFAAKGGSPIVYERATMRDGVGVQIRRTLMPQGGFVLTLTDMTERVQAERMLGEAQKMHAMGQLTGGIAHDFNNMLTVILASLDVSDMERASAGDQQAALLTTRMNAALRAAETAAALTRQLLDFARKQPLAPVPVDMSTVLASFLPLLRHTIGESVALSFRSEADLWHAIIDTAQLESAVLNLALNARDAMPRGGTLAIDAANLGGDHQSALPRELAPGDYVRLSIADSGAGAGMSREVLARAFEPFFTTKSDAGTGLGLAMVFAFARQCGGHAMVQSEPGRGCTILIYLPRATPSTMAAQGAAARPRIMIVEDDPSIRQIAAAVLRELGYRVSEAHDAEEAIRQIDGNEEALDLLLTDLTLPGSIDGHALAARVRQGSPATRVLYMTGHPQARTILDASGEATTRWLGKPFRRHQLAAAVDALVAQPTIGQAA